MKIKTKKISATDTQGVRIMATAKGKTKTIPYDYSLDVQDCHLEAAKALWSKLNLSPAQHECLGDNIPRGKSRAVGYVFDFSEK